MHLNDGQKRIVLQEAIVVGNCSGQIKFSELNVDMFRVLQCLEREPSVSQKSSGEHSIAGNQQQQQREEEGEEAASNSKHKKRPNPHKYLLFQPTAAQLLLYLSSAFKELQSDTAGLLVYLSADGISDSNGTSDDAYSSGVQLATAELPSNADASAREMNEKTGGFYPADLLPFSRRPLFVIVESPNSVAFDQLKSAFNQPAVFLFSPVAYPISSTDPGQRLVNAKKQGNLMTMFFHSPCSAFTRLSGIKEMSPEAWAKCLSLMQSAESKLYETFSNLAVELDDSYLQFLHDDFTKRFIVRFVICYATLRCNREFGSSKVIHLL